MDIRKYPQIFGGSQKWVLTWIWGGRGRVFIHKMGAHWHPYLGVVMSHIFIIILIKKENPNLTL